MQEIFWYFTSCTGFLRKRRNNNRIANEISNRCNPPLLPSSYARSLQCFAAVTAIEEASGLFTTMSRFLATVFPKKAVEVRELRPRTAVVTRSGSFHWGKWITSVAVSPTPASSIQGKCGLPGIVWFIK